jgi:ketosteroid isomerase-like protein
MNRAREFSLMLVLLLVACGKAPVAPAPEAIDLREISRGEVATTAQRYGKAISVRDIESIQSFYAADAWLFPPQAPIAKTAAERLAYWQAQKLPIGASDSVGLTAHIEVAESGELAIEYGSFYQMVTDRQGKAQTTPHKYVAAWQKQDDGSWKVIADMWNTDQ